jgi:hypothetical protein
MIRVTEDDITINVAGNEIRFIATGGPEDPLGISYENVTDELSRDEIDQLQRALLNFLNTGYFDQEG